MMQFQLFSYNTKLSGKKKEHTKNITIINFFNFLKFLKRLFLSSRIFATNSWQKKLFANDKENAKRFLCKIERNQI